jgi:RimJ/RimL family protein N-acetyltransferase
VTSTAAALLMDRLGLTDDELCRVLGVDPLTVIAGDLDDKPQLPILLALTEEAAERVGEEILRRWLRASGPRGRPVEHLLAGDFPAFEDDLAALAERGFVLGGRPSRGVTVRRIRADEAETLRDIRLRALADDPLAFSSTHAREADYPAEQWATWARESADGPRQATFFAVGDPGDAPVGMAFAVIDSDDAALAHLFAMWVAAEARGTGAGAKLVAAVVDWAAAQGARTLRTSVTVGNDRAERLYERAAFRDTGVREPLRHSGAETAVLERRLGG